MSVARAGKKAKSQLAAAKRERKEKLKEMKKFLERLKYNENIRLASLESMRLAREMGETVARRDLDMYVRTVPNPNEARLRDLQYNFDEKSIAHVDVQVDILIYKDIIEQERKGAVL